MKRNRLTAVLIAAWFIACTGYSEEQQEATTGSLAETWYRQWEILQNCPQPDLRAGGLHRMGWIEDELVPGIYGHYPHWEGAGKHTGILALHPVSGNEPAKIRFTGAIDASRSVLCVEVCGNEGNPGDFVLQCLINGQMVGQQVIDGTRWYVCKFDIPEKVMRTPKADIQLWNTAGGKDPWHFENCYIDKIYFTQGESTNQSAHTR